MAGPTPNGPGGPHPGATATSPPQVPPTQQAPRQQVPERGRLLATAGAAGPPAPRDLASRPRRLAAYAIDLAILMLALSPLLIPAGIAQFHHGEALAAALTDPREQDVAAAPWWARQWFLAIVLAVGFALYTIPQVGLLGRTVGHRLLGLRVSRYDGRDPVGIPTATIRYVVYYGLGVIPVAGPVFVLVNYAWCLFDPEYRQCLHDKAAGTFVRRPARARWTPGPPSLDSHPAPGPYPRS